MWTGSIAQHACYYIMFLITRHDYTIWWEYKLDVIYLGKVPTEDLYW